VRGNADIDVDMESVSTPNSPRSVGASTKAGLSDENHLTSLRPSPRYVTESELVTIESCLTRWREEVEQNVQGIDGDVGSHSDDDDDDCSNDDAYSGGIIQIIVMTMMVVIFKYKAMLMMMMMIVKKMMLIMMVVIQMIAMMLVMLLWMVIVVVVVMIKPTVIMVMIK